MDYLPPDESLKDRLYFPTIGPAQENFARDGFVKLPGCFRGVALSSLAQTVHILLERGVRKDFLMEQSGYTPRRMTVVGGHEMNLCSPIMSLYRSEAILSWCRSVSDAEVCECPSTLENVIITSLTDREDTHGWHLDDYPFAFIIVVCAPEKGAGALLHYRTCAGEVRCEDLLTGDAYLMRTDTVQHSVSPLLRPSNRIIINFTYSVTGFDVSVNGSADLLCSAIPMCD